MSKQILVIDGQGGGFGASLIKYLREFQKDSVEIVAVGTNAIASSQMMKAGASQVASGENAIIRAAAGADIIIGPIAITWPNAMMGEVTPLTAEAVMSAPGLKILLPLNREGVVIVGVNKEPLPHLIKLLVEVELQAVFLSLKSED